MRNSRDTRPGPDIKLSPELQAKVDKLAERLETYKPHADGLESFSSYEEDAMDEAFNEELQAWLEPALLWFKRFGNAFFMLVPNFLVVRAAVSYLKRLRTKSVSAAEKLVADLKFFPVDEFDEFVPSLAIQLYKDVVAGLDEANKNNA